MRVSSTASSLVEMQHPLLLLLLLPLVRGDGGPEVQLPGGGRLRGVYQTSMGGREIAAFLGVPYAKKPNRFQVAERAEPWTGVRDATKMKPDCMQYSELTYQTHGSEDCLFANIYTPKDFQKSNKRYNVIIYIHGGGFSFMLGHYGPAYLLDHDVVLVSFTYRVGPLGFLSTGDRVLPGNLGLKDQSRLLKWVSENIKSFGGNPDSVLLSGTSAGGVSVHYHLLSPLSRGLFHRAFSMSGSSLCCWAQSENASGKAVLLAKYLNCPTTSSEEILNCLSQKEGKDIVDQMKKFQKWLYYPFTPFGPVVEPDSEDAFIAKHPSEAIRDGEAQEVPWLITLTSEEGLYPVADFVANETHLTTLDKKWSDIVPSLLDYEHTTTTIPEDEISEMIRDKYIGNTSVTDNIPGLISMCSDRLFVLPVVKAAELHAARYKSPVYSYYFSYRGKHSCSEVVSKSANNYGVSHGDDTAYIFQNEIMNAEDGKEDKKMIKLLTEMVVNFAVNGKPSLEGLTNWPEVRANEGFNYVHIKGPGKFEIKTSQNLGNPEFWGSLKLSED